MRFIRKLLASYRQPCYHHTILILSGLGSVCYLCWPRTISDQERGRGGSVGRASEFWLGGCGFDPRARSLLVGLVSIQCDQLRQKSCSPSSDSVWWQAKLSDVSLGTQTKPNHLIKNRWQCLAAVVA